MRSITSLKAGVFVYHDFPKSPWTAELANFQYCT